MDSRIRIWGWHGISLVLGISIYAARRLCGKKASNLRQVVRKYGNRVFVYEEDLLKIKEG